MPVQIKKIEMPELLTKYVWGARLNGQNYTINKDLDIAFSLDQSKIDEVVNRLETKSFRVDGKIYQGFLIEHFAAFCWSLWNDHQCYRAKHMINTLSLDGLKNWQDQDKNLHLPNGAVLRNGGTREEPLYDLEAIAIALGKTTEEFREKLPEFLEQYGR